MIKRQSKPRLTEVPITVNIPPPKPAMVSYSNYYYSQFQPTNDFIGYIARVENSVKAGFKNGKWYPHKSFEGGSDTIAYGHKIQPGENFSGGITQEQALELLKKDLAVAADRARQIVNKIYGPNSWERLDNKRKEMLVDFAFNGVLTKFPNFLQGVVLNLPKQMKAEYKRFSKGRELIDRNNQFAQRYL